jgi:hypothetical protein
VPFKLTHHDSKYFHAQGTNGPFKIAKRGLAKGQHEKYLTMCNGGVVPKKMARGGEVESPKLEEAMSGFLPPTTGQKVASAVLGEKGSVPRAVLKGVSDFVGPENPPVHYGLKLMNAADPAGIMGIMGSVTAPGKAVAEIGKAAAGAAPKAAARTRVGLIPWDEMKLPEAVAAARDKAHLLQLEGGHYIGAPPQVTNPSKLGAMRGKIDKAVERGAFGADWYERARGAISEISHDDPAMADKLSKMLANYSPQATPDANFGWAIQQTNRAAHEGPAASALVPPKTKAQAVKGAKIAAGEELDLGPKAGVYEQHINPNKADEAMVRGVNDLWQGRVFGYPPGKDTSVGTGLAAKAGFSDAQHSFMTGENLLAAERAKSKGLLPQIETPNVGNVQAASWVGQRYNQLLSKQKAGAAKAKEAGKPFKGKSDAALRERAAQSYDTSLDKYTGQETYETVPGRGVQGHLQGIQDLPLADRATYTRATQWSPAGQADPFYKAQGMPARPTQEGLGQFGNDFNPNVTAKPVVSYTKGKPTAGGMNAPDERMISDTNKLRTVLDAQDSGAYHGVRQSGGGQNAASVRFPQPLDEAATRNLYKQAETAGLNLIDTGGGTFTLTGDFGGMAAKDFTKRLGAMQEPLAGARATKGRFLSGHEGQGVWSPPWGAEGSGAVTEDLLKQLHPNTMTKIDASPELRALIGKRAQTDATMSGELGVGQPRADIQRLRGMISEEGLAGLQAYVAKHGSKGLPALIPVMLAEEAARAEKHSQGGVAGEQTPGYALGDIIPEPSMVPPTMPPVPAPGVNPWANTGVAIDPSLVTQPPPAQPNYGQGDVSMGAAAQEGQEPVGLASLGRGLARGAGQVANAVLPSNIGDPLIAAGTPGMAPPEQAPAPATAPYQGPGSPNWQGNPVQQVPGAAPPPIPQPPEIKEWGTGAPGEIAAGAKMAGTALTEKARLEKNALDEMSALQQRSANDLQSLTAGRAERYRQRTEISDAMERDLLDAKVNPNQFFESKDTGQKILAGIGMLFSGIGSGLTGKPNLAMDVINRAIDRDIDAQKFNINKKQNYLSYYVKKTGDELIATNYMKADLLDSVAAQIKAKELGMQASTVGPMAQIAYGQLKMQSAELRQRASLQEQQGQINDYNFRMQKMRLGMMQQMLGAQPGSAVKEDHTPWLNSAIVLGVVPRNETTQESRQVPLLDPRTGQPVINQATGRPETQTVMQKYWYADPERARLADGVFRGSETLIPSVQMALDILKKHPAGTSLYRAPQDNAALQQQLAHIYIAYEKTVNRVQRQPNEETLNVLKNALDKPGTLSSSVVGSSAAALGIILQQVEQTLQAERNGAYY